MWGETDAQKNWNDYWKQQGVNNRPKKHFPWKFIIFLCIITICVGQQIIRDKLFNYEPKETSQSTSNNYKVNFTHTPNPGTIDNQTNKYFNALKDISLQFADTITYLANSLNGEFEQTIFTEKVNEAKELYQKLIETPIDKKYSAVKTQADNSSLKIIEYLEKETEIKNMI